MTEPKKTVLKKLSPEQIGVMSNWMEKKVAEFNKHQLDKEKTPPCRPIPSHTGDGSFTP